MPNQREETRRWDREKSYEKTHENNYIWKINVLVTWVNNNGIVQEKEILCSNSLIYPVWSRLGINKILYYPYK